jgi:hypothetical protein
MAENKTSLTQKAPAAFLATVEHPAGRQNAIEVMPSMITSAV